MPRRKSRAVAVTGGDLLGRSDREVAAGALGVRPWLGQRLACHAAALIAALASTAVLAQPRNVTVLSHDGSPYDASVGGAAPRIAISQQFFARHQDAYDFLIVFPAFA